MEQKKDGISRQAVERVRCAWALSLDPPPVALRFASAGGFWRLLKGP
jgi:hypothetical protein